MIIAAQIIGGFILLVLGGEFLVRGSVALAQRLGMSPLVIGLTIVAFGTSSPELLISAQAAMNGLNDIALGNVIGSNLANILLVLGASALIFPITITKGEIRREAFILVGLTAIFVLIVLSGAYITRAEGGILLFLLLGYTTLTVLHSRKSKDVADENLAAEYMEEIENSPKDNLPLALVYVVGGIACLVFGADVLIEGAVSLARILGWSEAVIAVSLVAVGGSMPELVTSVVAAFRKHSDIALGNVLGSNIFNSLGVIGTASLLHPIEVQSRFIEMDIPVMAIVTGCLAMLLLLRPCISRKVGFLALCGYFAYIVPQVI